MEIADGVVRRGLRGSLQYLLPVEQADRFPCLLVPADAQFPPFAWLECGNFIEPPRVIEIEPECGKVFHHRI